MKKQIRQISKITARFSAYILVIGLLIPAQAVAQTKKVVSPSYLMFKVTVKGEGNTGDGVKWSVDRTYESEVLVELKTQGQIVIPGLSPEQLNQEIYGGGHPLNRLAEDVPMRITIKDSFESVTTEECPPANGKEAFEEITTITKTWEGRGLVSSGGKTWIRRFRAGGSESSSETFYNVNIPIFTPDSKFEPLIYTEVATVTSKRAIPKKVEKRSLSTIQIPIINGILENDAIHHKKDLLLDLATYTELEFDDAYRPSKPVIENIRDSQFESLVRIRYKVSSKRFTELPDIKE